MWAKSDVYHLAWIFAGRQQLSSKFRTFLEERVLPKFRPSMYATRLESDSGANHENIEHILRDYFGKEKVQCMECNAKVAGFYDGKGFLWQAVPDQIL